MGENMVGNLTRYQKFGQFQIIMILITIVFFTFYVSSLRIMDGNLCRHLPNHNPITSFLALILSFLLLRMIFREIEVPYIERKVIRGDLRDLPILLALMFPGTRAFLIFLPKEPSAWTIFITRLLTYVLLPTIYVQLKKEDMSSIGFRGRSLLFSDILFAFSLALIAMAAMNALNLLISTAIPMALMPKALKIPLASFPAFAILHSVDMAENVVWNGLIQIRIESYYRWSSKGFWIFFAIMTLLFNFYFEFRGSLIELLIYAPESTLGLLIDCYLFHITKRIAPSALLHWFINILSIRPVL